MLLRIMKKYMWTWSSLLDSQGWRSLDKPTIIATTPPHLLSGCQGRSALSGSELTDISFDDPDAVFTELDKHLATSVSWRMRFICKAGCEDSRHLRCPTQRRPHIRLPEDTWGPL